jgi:predicted unusual protein kinase regulating ubiquinone biosynthesis (AarF/ABC1/UbiB family)
LPVSLAEALAEQIYLHGFVHCDPHPGNIFVRWVDHGKVEQERHGGVWDALRSFVQLFWKRSETKSRELQVVLLDHGLYREMEEEVRINYCQLWKNLIIRDDDKVKEVRSSHAPPTSTKVCSKLTIITLSFSLSLSQPHSIVKSWALKMTGICSR